MTNYTAPENTTADEKAAYTAGWQSQAKTLDSALAGALRKYGEGSVFLNFFQDGYEDRQGGEAKWARLQPVGVKAADPVHVDVDGVTVAEVTHVDLTGDDDELAASVLPDDSEPAEASTEPEDGPLEDDGDDSADNGWVSIRTLRDSITKDMSRAEIAGIRQLVVTKKTHYRRGYAAGKSGLDQMTAESKYNSRREATPYLADWRSGFFDAQNNLECGAAWKGDAPEVKPETLAALHAEMKDLGQQ